VEVPRRRKEESQEAVEAQRQSKEEARVRKWKHQKAEDAQWCGTPHRASVLWWSKGTLLWIKRRCWIRLLLLL